MERPDPEELRGSELDASATMPISRERLERVRELDDAKKLEAANKDFHDRLAGRRLWYGGNEYDFIAITAGKNGPVIELREHGTNFITTITGEDFSFDPNTGEPVSKLWKLVGP